MTHGHCDHVSALDEVCTHYNIPAYLHPLDQELLQLIRRRPSVYKKKMYTHCNDLVEGQLQLDPLYNSSSYTWHSAWIGLFRN